MTQIDTKDYFKSHTTNNLSVKLEIVAKKNDEITLKDGTILTIPYDTSKSTRGIIDNTLKNFDKITMSLSIGTLGRCFI